MDLGVRVTLAVEQNGKVTVQILDLDELINKTTKHVVMEELTKHANLKWQRPVLYFLCSEVSAVIRRRLLKTCDALAVNVVSGHWTGPCSDVFMTRLRDDKAVAVAAPPIAHDWLSVTYKQGSIVFDPTYVQFDDAKSWCMAGCKDAASRHCK